AGYPEPYRRYAVGMVALAPDFVLATTTPTVLAVQRASRSVPIVFVGVIDAVGSGLVRSLAQPGGNATGFLLFEYSIASKWLELLEEIVPRVARVAVLRDAAAAAGVGQFAAVQTVAPIGVELRVIGIDDHGEIERTYSSACAPTTWKNPTAKLAPLSTPSDEPSRDGQRKSARAAAGHRKLSSGEDNRNRLARRQNHHTHRNSETRPCAALRTCRAQSQSFAWSIIPAQTKYGVNDCITRQCTDPPPNV